MRGEGEGEIRARNNNVNVKNSAVKIDTLRENEYSNSACIFKHALAKIYSTSTNPIHFAQRQAPQLVRWGLLFGGISWIGAP